MVRLNLEGFWIDLNDQEFELKWKHPIQTSLKGENTTYSTDITVSLTETNIQASDYKIFTDSQQTNKYLYGVLYINGADMRIRCYIKEFSPTSIKFYLEQFRKGTISNLLKDSINGATLDRIHLDEIQKGIKRDVLLSVQDATRYTWQYPTGQTLPDIFSAESRQYIDNNGAVQTRPYIFTDNILTKLAEFYGFSMINAPTNYRVYCNLWKLRTGISAKGKITAVQLSGDTTSLVLLNDMPGNIASNVYISGGSIVSTAPFSVKFQINDLELKDVPTGQSQTIHFYLTNSESGIRYEIGSRDAYFGYKWTGKITSSSILPAGTYMLYIGHELSIAYSDSIFEFSINYTDEELAATDFNNYVDFPLIGYFPCWQNLPKVTAKTLIETIATCAGKIVEYSDDSINFIDFENVFDWHNAIDVSNKLIEWKSKQFRFLESNNATVSYADGTIMATVSINDETLPSDTNNVATLDCIRVQDDIKNDRSKDKVMLSELTTGQFDIVSKLAMIYAPVVSPKLFEAEFIYFADNRRPLLIRQLGGIFIALESITTTKNTITLKLLKLR